MQKIGMKLKINILPSFPSSEGRGFITNKILHAAENRREIDKHIIYRVSLRQNDENLSPIKYYRMQKIGVKLKTSILLSFPSSE